MVSLTTVICSCEGNSMWHQSVYLTRILVWGVRKKVETARDAAFRYDILLPRHIRMNQICNALMQQYIK